jgi:glycosyltransferase involved in cell wall biosynthesis
MRILIVSAGPLNRQIGGGQAYVQDLAMGLRAKGHDIILLEPANSAQCPGGNIAEWAWEGIPVFSLSLPLPGERLGDCISELGGERLERVKTLLNRIKPHVVQINGMMPPLVSACRELGLRHLVVAHHPGEVCPKGDLLRPDDSICKLRPGIEVCAACVLRSKKPGFGIGRVLALMPMSIYRVLGGLLARKNPMGYLGRVLRIPWEIEQKLIGLASYLKNAQQVVAPSAAMGDALARAGVEPSRLQVLHHGIHPVKAPPIEELGARPIRFGFVGRIDHAKGVHVLLDAMALLDPDGTAELHIYGAATNPRDQAAWQRHLDRLGNPPWLHLHGAFARTEVDQVYANIDVLVLPAIYLEVFGLVVAEALSAGRPVLTTDCGGPAEQIVHGENGWIVPPHNVGALAEQLRRLVNSRDEILSVAASQRSGLKTHALYVNEIEVLILADD